MADFTYDSIWAPQNPYRKVRFGANAPVLETELNELQDILRNDMDNFLKNSVGSGVAYADSTVINGSTLTFNNFYTLVNGIPTQLNPTLSVSLPAQPSTGIISYFVFLEAWETTANYQSTIYSYGQFKGPTIPNNIIDPRVNVETTERLEQLWQIRIVQNDFVHYPSGFENPSVNVQAYYTSPYVGLNFKPTSFDANLYTVTLTDGTVVYAIPLLQIDATPTGYNVTNKYVSISIKENILNLQTQISQIQNSNNPYPQYILKNEVNGSQSVMGSIGLTGDLTVNNDVTIYGNLNVSGTTTSHVSDTYNVGTQWININENETGTPTLDAGIVVTRGTSPSVTLKWNEQVGSWQLTEDGTNFFDIALNNPSGTTFSGFVSFQTPAGTGFVGGDSARGIEIGSTTSGTHLVTLWNSADDIPMNLTVGSLSTTQNGIFAAGINVNGTSTISGPLNVNAATTINGQFAVQSSQEDSINTPALWIGNNTGYIRLTDGASGNHIESFNGAQNGNADLNLTGAYGNTGGNLVLNFNNINTLGTTNLSGAVIKDNFNLYFGQVGDNSDTIYLARTNDAADSSGLHIYLSDDGGSYPNYLQPGGVGDYFHIGTSNGTDLLYVISTGDVYAGRNVVVPGTLFIGDGVKSIPTHAAMSYDGNGTLVLNPSGAFNTGVKIHGSTIADSGMTVSSPSNSGMGNIYMFIGGIDFGYDGGSDNVFWFQHRTGTATNVGTTSFADANGKALLSITTDNNVYAYGNFGVQGTTTVNNLIVNDNNYLSFGTYFDNTDPIYFMRTDDSSDSSGLHLYIGDNGGEYPNYLQKDGGGDYLHIGTTNGIDIMRAISTGDVYVGRNLVVPNAIYMGTDTKTLPTFTALSATNNSLSINPNGEFEQVNVGSSVIVGNSSMNTAWIDVHAASDHGYQLDGKSVLGLFPGWNNDQIVWLNTHSTGGQHISYKMGVTSLGNFHVLGGNLATSGVNAPDTLSLSLINKPSTLTAGITYYYAITAVTAGESLVGPIEQITLDTNSHSIQLNWDETVGAYAYNVYRGLSANSLQYITQVDTFASNSMSWVDNGSLTPTSITPPTTNTTGGTITAIEVDASQANLTVVNAGCINVTGSSKNTIGGNTEFKNDVTFDGSVYFKSANGDANVWPHVYTTASGTTASPAGTTVHVVLGSGTSNSTGPISYVQIEDIQGNTLVSIDSGGNLNVSGNLNSKGLSRSQIFEVHDYTSFSQDTGELAPDPLSWSGKAAAYSPANGDKTDQFIARTGSLGVRYGDYAIAVRARFGPFVQDNTEVNMYQAKALGIKIRYYYNEGKNYFDQTEWFDSNQFMYGTSWYYQNGTSGDFGNNIYDVYYTQYVLEYFTTYQSGYQWISQPQYQNVLVDYDSGEAVDGDGDEHYVSELVSSGYWQYYYYPVQNSVWEPITKVNQYYIDYTNFYTNFSFQKQMTLPGTNTLVYIDSVDVGIVTEQSNYTLLVDSITIQPVHPGVLQ